MRLSLWFSNDSTTHNWILSPAHITKADMDRIIRYLILYLTENNTKTK